MNTSSSPRSVTQSGTIRQNQRIVGAICLPEAGIRDFVDEFNHCYGPLQLQIDLPAFVPAAEHPLIPVGARPPKAVSSLMKTNESEP